MTTGDVHRAGEYGPCQNPQCQASGYQLGPYTLFHRVLLCASCLLTAHRAYEDYPTDPELASAMTKYLDAAGYPGPNEEPGTTPGHVHWKHLLAHLTDTAADWLVEPVIPRGKSVALYAPAGEGKSELVLALALCAATGYTLTGANTVTPHDVLYIDLEQTEDILRDRVTDMGYTIDSDLSHLHYYLHPNLPPLDTRDGGEHLRELAGEHTAALVIIDTLSRVLEGAENDSDTMRAFHRHTGTLLKADGRSLLRVDHAGKDPAKGQRGTSAKNEDVDLVWRTERRDHGARLTAKKRRDGWIPERVDLDRLTDTDTKYRLTAHTWSDRTREIAGYLDQLNVARDAGRPVAREALATIGVKVRNLVLAEALRYRRETSGTAVGDSSNPPSGQSEGTANPKPIRDKPGTATGTAGDRGMSDSGDPPLWFIGQGGTHTDQPPLPEGII